MRDITLSATEDLINLGYLEISSSGTFNTTDDLILTGNSITIIDNTSSSTDDLYIEWTDAELCGKGAHSLGGGAGSTISYYNTATTAQICSLFTVECPTMDCTGVPATGTGSFISGNTGLGGVGEDNSLQLWLRADDLNLTDVSSVISWSDVSGNGLTASATGVSGTEPTFNTNTVNTSLPSLSFDEGDYLDLGQPASLDYDPGTDSWSFFIVYSMTSAAEQGTLFSKADETGVNRTYQYTIDDAGGSERYFSSFIGGNNTTGSTIDVSSTGTWHVSAHSNNSITRDSWTNENTDVSSNAIGTNNTGAVDVLIGARRTTAPSTGFGFAYTGRIAELAMYDGEMTEAQRIIMTNYLAAKYNISLGSNDLYSEDDNGFDHEMIGIGQASDGSNHKDSQGLGEVRVWNPDDLANNEFLMIGHNNVNITTSTTDLSEVDGTEIEQRLIRVWAVSESGNVGTVRVSINFGPSGGSPIGSNLRLLIDRDGDFSTNDVTPIVGSVFNNIAVFSNVDFQDGDQFTLGNTDASAPLPVELLSFTAEPVDSGVLLNWETATEINNDKFTLERSQDGAEWTIITEINGSGNSNERLKYSFLDIEPLYGTSFYRLKQTDFDGNFEYFHTVNVWFNNQIKTALKVFPNPSEGKFRLKLSDSPNKNHVAVFDMSGKKIDVKVEPENGMMSIDLTSYSAGAYLLTLRSSNGNHSVSRLIRK